MLRYIKRDIFNPLIRYPKYLKISSDDYKERIDNYTKYLKVKIKQSRCKISKDYMKISQVRYGVTKISQEEKEIRNFCK